MSKSRFVPVHIGDDELVLSGPYVRSRVEDGEWEALQLDKNRILVHRGISQELVSDTDRELSYASADSFVIFLRGLLSQDFSGMVKVDTGRGLKRLFFNRGELVFAGSNVMDDRLGEVVYRRALIDLSQLTDSAVKVTREQKFGQVLLGEGIFDVLDLWVALKIQFSEILRSVFLGNFVTYKVYHGELPPMVIRFEESGLKLVEQAYSFSCGFKAFLRRINLDSQIIPRESLASWKEPAEGTFAADFLELVRNYRVISDVVKNSKLTDINTFQEIYRSIRTHHYEFSSNVDPVEEEFESDFEVVQNKLHYYGSLLEDVRVLFSEQGLEFPLQSFKKFIGGIDLGTSISFFGEQAEVGPLATDLLRAEWQSSTVLRRRLASSIDLTNTFLLQMASDLLPYSVSQLLKKRYYSKIFEL